MGEDEASRRRALHPNDVHGGGPMTTPSGLPGEHPPCDNCGAPWEDHQPSPLVPERRYCYSTTAYRPSTDSLPTGSPLRGYVVTSKWEESAVLAFATSAREAKRMAWRILVEDYMECDYTEIRVRWCRESDPKTWGVTEPCVLQPAGCERCERWNAAGPVDPTTGLCAECFEDKESWDV